MSYTKKIKKAEKKGLKSLKITRYFISIRKEKEWLEDMARQGYFLSQLKLGMNYTFEKKEPKNIIYEIDRFNIPKNPTLMEIRQKIEFIETAKEMGWNEITHDEDLNYYFAKEYEEDGINELYNDYESRELRANKYYNRCMEQSKLCIGYALLLEIASIFFEFIFQFLLKESRIIGIAFVVLSVYLFILGLFGIKFSNKIKKELIMSSDEWKIKNTKNPNMKEEKFKNLKFVKLTKITEFLNQRSIEGWQIVEINKNKYLFEKNNDRKYKYIIDSKKMTMNRIEKKDRDNLNDSKDILLQSNDWQVRSLEDATKNGWEFVLAISNQLVFYRSEINNEGKEFNNSKKSQYYSTNIFEFDVKIVVGILIIVAIAGFVIGMILGKAVAAT